MATMWFKVSGAILLIFSGRSFLLEILDREITIATTIIASNNTIAIDTATKNIDD